MAEKKHGGAPRVNSSIKAGDTVYILTGKDYADRLSEEDLERLTPEEQKQEVNRRPGTRGRVLRVLPEKGRAIIEGVNIVIKHSRPKGRASRAQQLQTGRIEQPGTIALSNVMLVCPRCDRPARVRRGAVEGHSVRLCRRCGESVDVIK